MAKKNKAADETTTDEATTTEEKPARAKLESKNGVTRPSAGTATGRVWEISDALSADAGAPVRRKDVMDAGKAEGLNEATIATQYGRWRKFYGLGRDTSKADAAAAVDAEGGETDVTGPEAE